MNGSREFRFNGSLNCAYLLDDDDVIVRFRWSSFLERRRRFVDVVEWVVDGRTCWTVDV